MLVSLQLHTFVLVGSKVHCTILQPTHDIIYCMSNMLDPGNLCINYTYTCVVSDSLNMVLCNSYMLRASNSTRKITVGQSDTNSKV